jgi:hypothetical protein
MPGNDRFGMIPAPAVTAGTEPVHDNERGC